MRDELTKLLEKYAEKDEFGGSDLIWTGGYYIDDGIKFESDLMQLIDSYCDKQRIPTAIMGKPIDEVYVILNALDLERITNIKVTMSNLDKLYMKLREDVWEANQKAINATLEQTINRIKKETK